MEIDLGAPGLIEIVRVTEDDFVAKIDMCRAGDELVVVVIISGFDVGLRIDMLAR